MICSSLACAGFNARAAKTFPLCVLLTVSGACSSGPPQPQRAESRRAAVQIQTTQVERISIQRQVDVAGTMVSPDQAKVSSEVGGVIRQVLMELGQEVRPGQILVQLEPQELTLALRRAESNLRQTEAQLGIDGTRVKEPPPDEEVPSVRRALANLEDARVQLARAVRLNGQGLLPQVDLDAAQTRMKVNEAAYQSALEEVRSLRAGLQEKRAAYELAQKKLNDASIRSPVSGSVSERLVHPGEYIRENTPVVVIVQMNPLKLRTAVQERHAGLIQPGLPVQFKVESLPGVTFEGKVAFVSPAVEQATRTFTVEILVDNHDRRLKPGFFAKGVIFTRQDANVLAVPEDAVSTLAGVSTVFAVENDKVRPQIVTLGVHEGKFFEVVEGLKGTEVLAVTNLSQLATGVPVETRSAVGAHPPASQPGQPRVGRGTGQDGQGERP